MADSVSLVFQVNKVALVVTACKGTPPVEAQTVELPRTARVIVGFGFTTTLN
jgi:hypothetical protein